MIGYHLQAWWIPYTSREPRSFVIISNFNPALKFGKTWSRLQRTFTLMCKDTNVAFLSFELQHIMICKGMFVLHWVLYWVSYGTLCHHGNFSSDTSYYVSFKSHHKYAHNIYHKQCSLNPCYHGPLHMWFPTLLERWGTVRQQPHHHHHHVVCYIELPSTSSALPYCSHGIWINVQTICLKIPPWIIECSWNSGWWPQYHHVVHCVYRSSLATWAPFCLIFT